MSELNEFMSRIEEIEKQESLLRDNTQDLKDSMLENQGFKGNNLRQFIEQQSKKVEELAENLSQARTKTADKSPNGINSQTDNLFKNMLDKTQQLENWLKNMDFNQASQNAKNIYENIQGLRDMSKHNFADLGKAAQELNDANKIAGEINRDLKNLKKQASGGNQLGKMAKRQDEIQAETDDLTQKSYQILKADYS
ncbi:MAG: hypothetical protein GWN40_10585 [Nitrosopumilaceae archaeon]|nr:hypothetical protein [Nitrosopumilaceae archaeon]